MKTKREEYEKEDVSQVYNYRGMLVNLRPYNAETDLPFSYKWVNDELVNRNLMVAGPLTLMQEQEWTEQIGKDSHNVIFAIETRDENRFIGTMGIHRINWVSGVATTGALIGEKDCWNKGYGSDAKMLLLHHAFHKLNLRRIDSSVIKFNKRSAGSLIKCGYKKEGTLEKHIYQDGKYWDRILFRIFRSEFEPLWKAYAKKLKKFNREQTIEG